MASASTAHMLSFYLALPFTVSILRKDPQTNVDASTAVQMQGNKYIHNLNEALNVVYFHKSANLITGDEVELKVMCVIENHQIVLCTDKVKVANLSKKGPQSRKSQNGYFTIKYKESTINGFELRLDKCEPVVKYARRLRLDNIEQNIRQQEYSLANLRQQLNDITQEDAADIIQ